MKLEHRSEQEVKKLIRDIIGQYLDLDSYQVFVFGSRVEGKNRDGSDIDVGILGPRPVPGQKMSAIREEFEEYPILYQIDVRDLTRTSHTFREVALQHTEPLTYE